MVSLELLRIDKLDPCTRHHTLTDCSKIEYSEEVS